MLINLHVKNLALIEETNIDFTSHLNILTGETGAGKSILIGSIQSALGSKIPKDMIRHGCDSALIELVFDTHSDVVRQKMEEYDIPCEDGQIIISRRITNSRVINKINDCSVTAARLRELSPHLLDLSGQHENQLLLRTQNHLKILDNFDRASLSKIKQKTGEYFRRYQTIKRKLAEQTIGEEERLREIEFLKFEIQEIEGAALKKGEDEELEERYQKIAHSKDILSACSSVYEKTSDGSSSAQDIIGSSIRTLSEMVKYDDSIKEFLIQLSSLDGLLNDFNRELSEYISSMDFDEKIFAETEERLEQINRLKSRYGSSLEEIEAYRNKAKERLYHLLHFEEETQELKKQEKELLSLLDAECETLTKLRKKAAKPLQSFITEALRELNFLDVRFEIRFSETEHYTAEGKDAVCFMISTNPGIEVRPLHEIASGGELSRIMLAIKSALAEEEQVETLIFDEIDAGISGRTAQKVSERLLDISGKRQVIAITHLPQIAAMADSHYLIEKTSEANAAISRIYPLSEEESVEELARMLGGAEITSTVLENAREMKSLASRLRKERS
ncbi:MAG: DNA repair protein RecN [Eubacteriales bacterium]|nr:DNA repair protein RecN [Eubacteriales bacterium]